MTTDEKLKVAIVDDEPLARKRIRTLLKNERDVEIVAESGDGRDAVAAIRRTKPDLLFLDVQMPELDGFGVLDELSGGALPVVIFVTAYDRYALRAFEVHALDYLLKPFDEDRFQDALERAREQARKDGPADLEPKLRALIEQVRAGASHVDRVMIKASGRVLFLKTSDIDWIEASGNYVRFHVGRESYLLRETMNAVEVKLDPSRFVRIHRSTMVNIDRIQEMQPWFGGDHVLKLRDGTELRLSRSYRERFDERFGEVL